MFCLLQLVRRVRTAVTVIRNVTVPTRPNVTRSAVSASADQVIRATAARPVGIQFLTLLASSKTHSRHSCHYSSVKVILKLFFVSNFEKSQTIKGVQLKNVTSVTDLYILTFFYFKLKKTLNESTVFYRWSSFGNFFIKKILTQVSICDKDLCKISYNWCIRSVQQQLLWD